jgi:hypothetical protein
VKTRVAGTSQRLDGWCIGRLLLLLAFLPGSFSQTTSADNRSLADSAKQLAERVAAIPGLHSPLLLELQGEESAKAVASTEWQSSFEQELRRHHIEMASDASASLIRVYVTQTPTQLVFVAKIQAGDRDEVKMVTVGRQGVASTEAASTALRLERQLIYQTPNRILDAAYPENSVEGGLVVLTMRDAELVATRLNEKGETSEMFTLTIPSGTLGRDARAELSISGSRGDMVFNSRSCQFDSVTGNNLKCHSGKPDWREKTELAASCDEANWALESNGSDWTASEVLSAVRRGESGLAAPELHSEFPGPILAIHEGSAQDSALVAARNLRTGNYELYKVMLACGD